MSLVQNPTYLSFYHAGKYLTFLYNPPHQGNNSLGWIYGKLKFDAKKLTIYPFIEILDLR